jgi:hypothetical protein
VDGVEAGSAEDVVAEGAGAEAALGAASALALDLLDFLLFLVWRIVSFVMFHIS